MPEFTIFTCTYQNASFIDRCYRSILQQHQTDWEWLIIDDGSTDATESVIRSITDTRIVYKKLETNQGRGIARNIGLSYIRGSWVIILDMDDMMLPNRLDYVRKAITNKCDFMISEVAVISNDLICTAIRPAFYQKGIKVFTHATLCCRTDIYKKVGYFNSRYSEDQQVIVTFAFKDNCFVVDEPLYLYQESANQNIKGAIKANLTAFKLLLGFTCGNSAFLNIKMLKYVSGFLIRYLILSLTNLFSNKYEIFIKKRVVMNLDKDKIQRVNSFIAGLKASEAI